MYDELDREFHFDFDPCPYNPGEIVVDGLLVDWGNMNFVNPPYSPELKLAFVLKAVDQKLRGRSSVLLIPAQTGTKLFHDVLLPNADEIRFRKGRIQFVKLDADGNTVKNKNGNPLDSMIVVFKADLF